ncbi:MAG TPA: metal-dependent hydrolase [Paenibacillaceae bacterium]
MDTGTHLLFGLGLGGLALIDPYLAEHPSGQWAVMIGTVLGSQAPDADIVLKLKSYPVYLRHHRGISHSVPFLFVWTGLITAVVAALFPEVPWQRTAPWILLATAVHVATDLFNPYGTQGFWPFSRKWIAWSAVHIIDPVVFTAHLAAIALWMFGGTRVRPGALFAVLYAALALYFIWRVLERRRIGRRLPAQDPSHRPGDRYALLPTFSLGRWSVLKESEGGVYAIGEWTPSGGLKWHEVLRSHNGPQVDAASRHPDVQTLLRLTPFACVQVHPRDWGYEVRWIDLRFPARRQDPFAAIVLLDKRGVPFRSHIGWLNGKSFAGGGG